MHYAKYSKRRKVKHKTWTENLSTFLGVWPNPQYSDSLMSTYADTKPYILNIVLHVAKLSERSEYKAMCNVYTLKNHTVFLRLGIYVFLQRTNVLTILDCKGTKKND